MLFRSKIFKVIMVKMLCGCIGFRLKPKATRNGLEPSSTLEELASLGWTRFDRAGAPSPPERPHMSLEGTEPLITPKREAVMEPSVESQFQVLKKIDSDNSIYQLSKSTI